MAQWKNLDTLKSFKDLADSRKVDLTKALAGDAGAARVAKYRVPMAAGLSYYYAAKQVDDGILAQLKALAEECGLAEKFEELYSGEVINTGEKRRVLHQLTRGQLGKAVIADGVARSSTKKARYLPRSCKSVSAAATWGPGRCIWRWKTGLKRTAVIK